MQTINIISSIQCLLCPTLYYFLLSASREISFLETLLISGSPMNPFVYPMIKLIKR